jgi:hypothetical protein
MSSSKKGTIQNWRRKLSLGFSEGLPKGQRGRRLRAGRKKT